MSWYEILCFIFVVLPVGLVLWGIVVGFVLSIINRRVVEDEAR